MKYKLVIYYCVRKFALSAFRVTVITLKVPGSTQRKALNALVFLYREGPEYSILSGIVLQFAFWKKASISGTFKLLGHFFTKCIESHGNLP